MTPQELKNSILQLAIQGKLVEQRPEEGTAEELYKQIQAEKQALIKAGKIKKEKPLPEITENEIPFEIPESWKWVRFGFLSQLLDGEKRQGEPYPCLDAKFLRGKSEVLYLNSGKFVCRGEKIILVDGENSGEVFVVPQDGYMGSTFKKLFYSSAMYEPYVLFFLLYHKKDYRNNKKGSAIPHLNKDLFFNMPTPLPPFAEQKRIVAKIEELLPLIERYEKAWSRLEEFNKRFPVDMQKSILQMAIQGRLVEQRPEEGTGEELYRRIQAELKPLILAKRFKGKKLPDLSDDELPFEIPSSWKWVRLGDIISIESGKNLTSSQMRTGSVPVYGGNGITGYHDESLVHEETVVIGRVGFYCGSVHVTEKEAWITDNAFITTYPSMSIDRSFLVYILRHMDLGRDNNATAQPVVSGKKIYPLAFPLPPLAEQKRIVARLEELLPLCERLK